MTTVKLEPVELLACRVCLATDTRLFGIHEFHLKEAFSELIGTPLNDWDGLPQHICSCCRTQLLKSCGLRGRCLRAQDLLKQALSHEFCLTTDYIKTIDRASNCLCLPLTIEVIDQKPIEFTHEEDVKNGINLTETAGIRVKRDLFDNDDDTNHDVSVLVKGEELFVETVKENPKKPSVKSVKSDKKVQKKVVKERKKVKKQSNVEQKIKQKGAKKRFNSEQDYVDFENKYNMSIVKLSEEEQRRDMAARRLSANYARALVRCDKCHKGFLAQNTFENHMKTHDPSAGASECQLCFVRFQTPTQLRRHTETHRLKFICQLCPLVTRHRNMATRHADFHAGKTSECKHCGLTFSKKSTYNSHMRTQHPLENTAAGACAACGETFVGAMGLKLHRARALRQGGPAGCSAPAGARQPQRPCAACGAQLAGRAAAARHAAVCDPALKACAACGDVFPAQEQLAAHAARAHAAPAHKCDDCDKSFASAASLSTHADRVHRRLKPRKVGYYKYMTHASAPAREVCEVCGKGYPTVTLLKYHQRAHTGERPYKCKDCPKRFTTSTALRGHAVSHSRERRWRCPHCPQTFLRQASIYKHQVIHTGEKPFECQICHKTFTQSGSLSTHVKYVHMKEKPPPRKRRRDAPAKIKKTCSRD